MQYVAHLDLLQDQSALIVTTTNVVLIDPARLKLRWELPLDTLQTISLEPSGLSFVLRSGSTGPFVPIPDVSSKLWLFKHLETVRTGMTRAFADETAQTVRAHNSRTSRA